MEDLKIVVEPFYISPSLYADNAIDLIKTKTQSFPTQTRKIEYLKSMASGMPIDRAWNYYCHGGNYQEIKPVWEGVFSARAGNIDEPKYSEAWQVDSFRVGVVAWNNYCTIKQMIIDL